MVSVKKCPDCFIAPAPRVVRKVFGEGHEVEVRCDRHGHTALGDTHDKAVENWNIYVTFVEETRTTEKKENPS